MIQAQCDHCDEWFLHEYGKKDRLRQVIWEHEVEAHDIPRPAYPLAWLEALAQA